MSTASAPWCSRAISTVTSKSSTAAPSAQLRDINVGTSMMAAPMTYRIGGEQYVAVMAGIGEYPGYVDYRYGQQGRILAGARRR